MPAVVWLFLKTLVFYILNKTVYYFDLHNGVNVEGYQSLHIASLYSFLPLDVSIIHSKHTKHKMAYSLALISSKSILHFKHEKWATSQCLLFVCSIFLEEKCIYLTC